MAAEQKQPDLANGKVCYIIIPAADIDASADFFKSVSNGTLDDAAKAR